MKSGNAVIAVGSIVFSYIMGIVWTVAMFTGLTHWLGWPWWGMALAWISVWLICKGVGWVCILFCSLVCADEDFFFGIGAGLYWALFSVFGAWTGIVAAHVGWGWELKSAVLLFAWWPIVATLSFVYRLIAAKRKR